MTGSTALPSSSCFKKRNRGQIGGLHSHPSQWNPFSWRDEQLCLCPPSSCIMSSHVLRSSFHTPPCLSHDDLVRAW